MFKLCDCLPAVGLVQGVQQRFHRNCMRQNVGLHGFGGGNDGSMDRRRVVSKKVSSLVSLKRHLVREAMAKINPSNKNLAGKEAVGTSGTTFTPDATR